MWATNHTPGGRSYVQVWHGVVQAAKRQEKDCDCTEMTLTEPATRFVMRPDLLPRPPPVCSCRGRPPPRDGCVPTKPRHDRTRGCSASGVSLCTAQHQQPLPPLHRRPPPRCNAGITHEFW